MFVPNLVGTLMKIEEDPVTRYHYEVWFDYTRKAINTIGEGAMLAAPNFSGNDHEIHYSILEVTGILPMHYALGNDTSGYPGFVVEAARNAGQDWTTQTDTSTEDTTKIRCVAVPTNLEIVEKPLGKDGHTPTIQEEGNVPMVGHQVYLLDTSMTERIANLNIDLAHDNAIQIGTLVRDPQVRAFLRVEDLIKVHFGIFGFTGAGKSNLLSTLIRKLLTESKEPIKVVIFDLMSEYTGLLLDQLVSMPMGYIVNLGVQTVPESVLAYYAHPAQDRAKKQEQLKKATIEYTDTTVLPKSLKRRQSELHRPIAMLLRDKKVVIWQSRQKTAGEIIESERDNVLKGNLGNALNDVRKLINELANEFRDVALDIDTFSKIKAKIESFQATPKLPATVIKNLDGLVNSLQSSSEQPQVEIPQEVRITVPRIIDILSDTAGSALLIVQSHNPDELRKFASMLGDLSYEHRRKSGKITPLVSFVFDEADEFIPGQPNDSQKLSRDVVMTLARRGRKFGLGIGIATQRIRYLDTSILAQPHTYFVSKLPRLTDRQAIAEAFGISEDMFRQTFKFKKGDWLLASYDAAGLEAIPIPIHAENADDKIIEFIEKQRTTSS
jgi:hypothetical protein